jgi:hypothetical protein
MFLHYKKANLIFIDKSTIILPNLFFTTNVIQMIKMFCSSFIFWFQIHNLY